MRRVPVDPLLVLALVGLALMSLGTGLALVPAAGLIVFGAGLLAYAVFLSPEKNGGPPP